jgi:hypothetical protein
MDEENKTQLKKEYFDPLDNLMIIVGILIMIFVTPIAYLISKMVGIDTTFEDIAHRERYTGFNGVAEFILNPSKIIENPNYLLYGIILISLTALIIYIDHKFFMDHSKPQKT